MNSPRERLVEIIGDTFSIEDDHKGKLKSGDADDTNFVDVYGADSLDLTELVMETEEEFDITISDEEVKLAVTFGKFLELIETKTSKCS